MKKCKGNSGKSWIKCRKKIKIKIKDTLVSKNKLLQLILR